MMKVKAYLAAILIFNGFISYNVHAIMGPKSNAHAFMGPKRWAQCAFMPGKYECSVEEKKKARKWLAGASVIVISAIAAGLGIKMTKDEIKKRKQSAQQDPEGVGEPTQAAEYDIQPKIQAFRDLSKKASDLSTQFKEITERAKIDVSERDIKQLQEDINTLNGMWGFVGIIQRNLRALDTIFEDSIWNRINKKDQGIITLSYTSIGKHLEGISQANINDLITKLENDLSLKEFSEKGR